MFYATNSIDIPQRWYIIRGKEAKKAMHKVLVRIDREVYERVQRWCYKEKSEGRQMSFQKFFLECINDGIAKRSI